MFDLKLNELCHFVISLRDYSEIIGGMWMIVSGEGSTFAKI